MSTSEVRNISVEESISDSWIVDEDIEDEESQIDEYNLISSPNDFNVTTIYSFIESGAVRIPGFQRNYVWDIKRASKLIESIIIGLPVPQVFLYEDGRNKFLVIDGQQRLMSIYYFMKQRFPRKEKRAELRQFFDQEGRIADNILYNDKYFTKFDLALPRLSLERPNKFTGLNYSTLGDHKVSFDLRTIRNVIVKQTHPRNDDSSIYEIFNRLNSGGINLSPQEIRMSLYHSNFYEMLYRLNMLPRWRKLINLSEPDLRMRDMEIILRSFSMLVSGEEYRSPMARFLDTFSKQMKTLPISKIEYMEELFQSFVEATNRLPVNAFLSDSGKFNISVFEAVFAAVCYRPYSTNSMVTNDIDPAALTGLRSDTAFLGASQKQTTNKNTLIASCRSWAVPGTIGLLNDAIARRRVAHERRFHCNGVCGA